jgi:hypothetical protein
MTKLKAAQKALVAVLALGVAYGILDDGTVQDILTVATPVLVWLVPNQ